MEKKELLNGLKEARRLLTEQVPVIVAWTAVKALDEAIRQMERKQAEVA
ncbi:MAG: hypothetical protein J6Y48_09680 [Clostridia bacterium]|nr:hypothetical protein [Clostridia bacterium]